MTDTDPNLELEKPPHLFPLIRHLSYPLSLALNHLPVTPNQLTSLSMVCGLSGAWMLRHDDYASTLIAAFLLLGYYILDNSDGEIARLKGMTSEFGKRYDTFNDWIVHTAIFLCLGWGVAEKSGNEIWLWFGGAAAVGGTINYIIDTIRDTREKAAGMEKIEDGPDESAGDRMVFSSRVVRTDFCFIVLVLALIDAVRLLLPASAIGAQVYWGLQFVKNFRRHHV